ncbi:PilZ domain-containing protein [Aureimonas sp. AU20]|uniref:PilZ domain-containing protein n=1 Tax=Aureimonas sp. AU20 TaxID=1349819 RepID=UPI0007204834|nr:PilZ domain-containing protein [Aureimonas sp. AU20]ALN73879.1 hypothetical protein M673_14225 [Aureimonas sp. AU20]
MALAQPESDSSERRVAPRTRIFKRAQILFNNRYSTVDCIVRNISATGALLTIDGSVPLPKHFEFRMGDDEAIRSAKLVYRRELFAGIHFLDVAHDGEETVSVVPHAASMAGLVAQAESEEGLRLFAKPLPISIASRLPWHRG